HASRPRPHESRRQPPRTNPILGEMGSTNPVFLLPGAVAARGREIAVQLYGSFTLGSGQFCTKPGMVFFPESESSVPFLSEFQEAVARAPKFTLLTSGIRDTYQREILNRKERGDIRTIAVGEAQAPGDG